MKKLILLTAWFFVSVVAVAQTTARETASSASNFANADNVFLIMGIFLVAAFVLIPVYSMSRAVKVLAKRVVEK